MLRWDKMLFLTATSLVNQHHNHMHKFWIIPASMDALTETQKLECLDTVAALVCSDLSLLRIISVHDQQPRLLKAV